MKTLSPEALYHFYCEIGERENRIKEFKVDLSSGRTSCHRSLASQARLLLHVAANVLMSVLKESLTLGSHSRLKTDSWERRTCRRTVEHSFRRAVWAQLRAESRWEADVGAPSRAVDP